MKTIKHILALSLAICMLTALVICSGVFTASAMAGAGAEQTTFRSYGADISSWNVNVSSGNDYSKVDFAKMKADGCEFVILRIGYEDGTTRENVMDSAFLEYYKRGREAGMPMGVYFYQLGDTYEEAIEDANWVINIIEENDMYFEYPIYYDVEAIDSGDNPALLDNAAMEQLCLGWCETMDTAGYFPGIYGGGRQVHDKLSADFKSKYDSWYAAYPSEQDPHLNRDYSAQYNMWQYAYKGYNYDGVPANAELDVNVCYKDYPTIMEQYSYNNCGSGDTDDESTSDEANPDDDETEYPISLNKTYNNTVSNAPLGSGTGMSYNALLTDGIASDEIAYDDDSWYIFGKSFGNCNDGVGTIIIDLGASTEITSLRAHLANVLNAGIAAPAAITVSGSTDGESYESITTLPISYEDNVVYWAESTAPAGTKARFVKFDFALNNTNSRYMAFLNELEVYGEWIAHETLPEWHSAPNTHWRECSCGSIVESSTHDRGIWTLVEAPTADKEGAKERRCSVCGYVLETASVSFGHQNLNKFSLAINAFNPNDIASGTSAILTKPYEIDGYEEIIAFQQVTGNVYRVVAISGYDYDYEAGGDVLAIPLDIPENGFVWAIQWSDNSAIDMACIIANQIKVGEEYVIEGIDLASETYTEVTISSNHVADGTWHSDSDSHWHECTYGEIIDEDSHDDGEWVLVAATKKELRCTVCDYVLDTIPLGDVDYSGAINSIDYTFIQRAYFGTYTLSDDEFKRGDVNNNGEIDSIDYLIVKSIVFGLTDKNNLLSYGDTEKKNIFDIEESLDENKLTITLSNFNTNVNYVNFVLNFDSEHLSPTTTTPSEIAVNALLPVENWEDMTKLVTRENGSQYILVSAVNYVSPVGKSDILTFEIEFDLNSSNSDCKYYYSISDVQCGYLNENNITTYNSENRDCEGDMVIHNADWVIVDPADVDKDGKKELICSACKTVLDSEVIPATHTTQSVWSSDSEGHWKYCSCCWGRFYSASHDDGIWVITEEAGVCKTGSKELRCSVCGYVLDTAVIPAASHNYSENYTASSEEHWHVCTCGEKFDVASHDNGIWVTTKEAEFHKAGSKELRCSVCGYVFDTEDIPALHSFGSNWKNDKDSHWHECTCGTKESVASHDSGVWVTAKEADVDKAGLKELRCTVCGYVLDTEDIPATHAPETSVWFTDANNHWQECGCGKKLNATAHTSKYWIIVTEAGEKTDGKKELRCTVCNYLIDSAVIPATNPNTSNGQPQIIINGNIIINGGLNINNQYNNININSGNAFSGDTTISVNEIKDGELYNVVSDALSAVSSAFTAYDFTATKDGKEVQPSETFTIDFAIPETFSNDVSVLYVSPEGKTEAVPSTVNEEKRIVTAEISHFSVYVLVDNSSKQTEAPSDYTLGDVNKSGDIDSMDYVLLKRAYFGTFALSEEAKKAADVNKSGDIDSMDYVLVKRAYFGTFQIK